MRQTSGAHADRQDVEQAGEEDDAGIVADHEWVSTMGSTIASGAAPATHTAIYAAPRLPVWQATQW